MIFVSKLKYLIPILIICLLLLFIKFTDNPSFRLDSLKCHKDIIYNSYGDIDYLIIGSSRTKQGIDVLEFSNSLDGNNKVVNFSRSWRGNGNIYHLIREFLENHNIRKKILIEYSSMEFRKKRGKKTSYNNGYYPNYNLVTDSRYLMDDFFYTPRDPIFLRFRDLVFRYTDLLNKRIDYFFKNIKNINLSPNVQKEELGNKSCFTRDNKTKSELLKNLEKKYKNKYKEKTTYWDISQINYDRHSLYIEKIKKIANEKNIDVILFHIPHIYQPMLSADLGREIENKYGLPFIFPDSYFMLDTLYQIDNYTDRTHMGVNGRIKYTKWLADKIKKTQ